MRLSIDRKAQGSKLKAIKLIADSSKEKIYRRDRGVLWDFNWTQINTDEHRF
jgi:hypothetical protein